MGKTKAEKFGLIRSYRAEILQDSIPLNATAHSLLQIFDENFRTPVVLTKSR